MTEPLTREQFLPYVKKKFRIRGGRHAFTLDRVEGPAVFATLAAGAATRLQARYEAS